MWGRRRRQEEEAGAGGSYLAVMYHLPSPSRTRQYPCGGSPEGLNVEMRAQRRTNDGLGIAGTPPPPPPPPPDSLIQENQSASVSDAVERLK